MEMKYSWRRIPIERLGSSHRESTARRLFAKICTCMALLSCVPFAHADYVSPYIYGTTNVGGDQAIYASDGTTDTPSRPVHGAADFVGTGLNGQQGTSSVTDNFASNATVTAGIGIIHANIYGLAPRPLSMTTLEEKINSYAQVSAQAYVGFGDTFSNNGAAPINILVTVKLDGTMTGAAQETLSTSFGIGNYAQSSAQLPPATATSVNFLKSVTLTLQPGQILPITYDLLLTGGSLSYSQWDNSGVLQQQQPILSAADFSSTGHLFVDVLTPGGELSTLSGHDYSSPVPVPASVWLFGTALGLLGLRRKRTA
jgi:hypothetical protein